MVTKIIKLHDGSTTYAPVTLASAVQYSYAYGKAMSVQDAIGVISSTVVESGKSVSDAIKTHVGGKDTLSYESGAIKLSGVHGQGEVKIAAGTGIQITYNSTDGIIFTAAQSHALNSDNQHITTSVDKNVAYINLDGGGNNAYLKNAGSATAGSQEGHITFTAVGDHEIDVKVTYTDTRPNDGGLSINADSGNLVKVFSADQSANSTVSILSVSSDDPIYTYVDNTGLKIGHKYDHVSGTFGTTATIVKAGDKTTITVPEITTNSYGHVTGAKNQSIEIDLSLLTGAMHYVGKKDKLPTTYASYKTGDVISVNSKEYVLEYENTSYAWRELGDEGSHALKNVTIKGDGVLEGGGDLSDNRTITHKEVAQTGDDTKTLSASSNTASDSVDVITAIKRDKYGHITGIVSGKTQNTHNVHGLSINSDKKISVTDSSSDSLTLANGEMTSVSVDEGTIKINHTKPTAKDTEIDGTHTTNITTDEYGHVTGTATTDIATMTGASSTEDGKKGFVPAPSKSDVTKNVVKVLGADGNWKTITATTELSDLTPGLKYDVYESDTDFVMNIGESTATVTLATTAKPTATTTVKVGSNNFHL